MTESDRAHILAIINRVSADVFDKYSAGVAEHAGHLPMKGGLMREGWCEILDLIVYHDTVREQLTRIEGWLEAGRVEDAMIGLAHILHGTPQDRLPT